MMMKARSAFKALREVEGFLGVWLWVIVFAAFFSLLSPYFLSLLNFLNIARQASVFGLMAIGMTLVIITGGIDLSVGSVVSLASSVFGVAWRSTGSLGTALALAFLSGAAIGALNGLLVSRVGVPPFIATFGTMGIGAGFAFALTPGSIGDFPEKFEYVGNGMLAGLPIPLCIVVAFALFFHYVLRRRTFGVRLLAIGGSELSSKLAGFGIRRYKFSVYLLNGCLAALAAIILCARIRSSYPGIGQDFELDVIASSVIGGASLMGGYGSIIGAMGGGFFITMIQNIFNLLGVYPFMQKVITGIFIVIAVLANQGKLKRTDR
jgi:ribose/xylose/arabinose/galactoside ABC-type transport system permease subunit